MTPELKAKLTILSAGICWSDDKTSEVDDYAGGNVDDAYNGGANDGRVLLARELLKEFGEA